MSRTMRRVALLVTLLLVVAGAAGASATDSRTGSNRLTGCRNTSTGVLDQVKAGLLPIGGVCGAGELMVSWNRSGPTGPQGPRGYAGYPGPTGAPGVSGYEVVVAHFDTADNNGQTSGYAWCPAGKVAVGGGYNSADPPTFATAYAYQNNPIVAGGQSGWQAHLVRTDGGAGDWQFAVFVICVRALP